MKSNKLKMPLLITGCVLALAIFTVGIILTVKGAGAFFGNISGNIADYNSISERELKSGLPIQGNVYYIYDRVVTEYSEKSNGERIEKAYYYAIPFEEDSVLIIKAKANSDMNAELDKLYRAPNDKAYEYMFNLGVSIEGMIQKNNPEVASVFNTWKQTYADEFMESYKIDITKFGMVPYICDCTTSVSARGSLFIVGLLMLLASVAAGVVCALKLLKSLKGNAAQSPAPAAAQNVGAAGVFPTQAGIGVSQQLTGVSQQLYTAVPQNTVVGVSQQLTGVSQQLYTAVPQNTGVGVSQQLTGVSQQLYTAVPQNTGVGVSQQLTGVSQQLYTAVPQNTGMGVSAQLTGVSQQLYGSIPQNMNVDEDDDDDKTMILGFDDDDDDQTMMLGYDETVQPAAQPNVQYQQVVTENSVRYEPVAVPGNNNFDQTVMPNTNNFTQTAVPNTNTFVQTVIPNTNTYAQAVVPNTGTYVQAVVPNTGTYAQVVVPNTGTYAQVVVPNTGAYNQPVVPNGNDFDQTIMPDFNNNR